MMNRDQTTGWPLPYLRPAWVFAAGVLTGWALGTLVT